MSRDSFDWEVNAGTPREHEQYQQSRVLFVSDKLHLPFSANEFYFMIEEHEHKFYGIESDFWKKSEEN